MNLVSSSPAGKAIILLLALLYTLLDTSASFTQVQCSKYGNVASQSLPSFTRLYQADDDSSELLEIKKLLVEKSPNFGQLMERNDGAWKALLGGDEEGFTIFVPTASAFAALGEKKLSQLDDPRNLETVQKIGSYHVIPERVTAEALYNAGGVITLGGELPVERSVSGGFGFGGVSLGGKEDGGVTVGGAKVVSSADIVGNGILHEVDGLVAPDILWRYMDQLRIPGSS